MGNDPKKIFVSIILGVIFTALGFHIYRNHLPKSPESLRSRQLVTQDAAFTTRVEPLNRTKSDKTIADARETNSDSNKSYKVIADDYDAQEEPASKFANDEWPNTEIVDSDEQIETAMEAWNSEKIAFYRDELGLDEMEIDTIHKLSLKAGDSIQAAVAAITATPPKISEDDYQLAIERLKDEENQAVKNLVGDELFKKMLAFRERWNNEIDSRFGVRLKVAGF